MSDKFPKTVVRQLGPDVWTFSGFDLSMDVGTEWAVVADTGVGSGTLITRIAGDAVDAHDSTPPIPYPDYPYCLEDVEKEAFHALKYFPGTKDAKGFINVECVNLYQLVGKYYKKDEREEG
jgi:hypothetical protein